MDNHNIKELAKQIRHERRERIEFLFPYLVQSVNEGDWERFCTIATLNHEVMPLAFKFYHKMPEEYRRDFVISCYSHHGDRLPACRQALRELPKNGKHELPEEYRDLPFITVYRAGEEDISKAKYRLSWTLDLDTAVFFMDTWCGKHAQAIYKAKIKPEDVIAYTNGRNEHEVLQYRKVYDIEVIRTKDTITA